MTIVSMPFEGAADAMSRMGLAGIVGGAELSAGNTGPLDGTDSNRTITGYCNKTVINI